MWLLPILLLCDSEVCVCIYNVSLVCMRFRTFVCMHVCVYIYLTTHSTHFSYDYMALDIW